MNYTTRLTVQCGYNERIFTSCTVALVCCGFLLDMNGTNQIRICKIRNISKNMNFTPGIALNQAMLLYVSISNRLVVVHTKMCECVVRPYHYHVVWAIVVSICTLLRMYITSRLIIPHRGYVCRGI